MIFKKIGNLLPNFYIQRCQKLINYAHVEKDPREFAGSSLLYSLLISLAVALISTLFNLSTAYILFFSILSFILSEVFFHLDFVFIGIQRIKKMEKLFPDILNLISANLRAGMTLDKSIWAASRPEFGHLAKELNDVGKDVVAGKPINVALKEMGERTNSNLIKQTIKLIVEGIKSGGKLERLLREIARDIRSMERISEEIKSSLTMYVMFIFFASAIASPFIFGSSSKFIEVSIGLQSMAASSGIGTSFMGLNQGEILITNEQLGIFYICQITIISLFASLLLGLIQKGNEKEGLKYLPFILSLAILTFFISRWISEKLVFI